MVYVCSLTWLRKAISVCVCVCVCVCAHARVGAPVHGIFQARILEWVAIPYTRGSS